MKVLMFADPPKSLSRKPCKWMASCIRQLPARWEQANISSLEGRLHRMVQENLAALDKIAAA